MRKLFLLLTALITLPGHNTFAQTEMADTLRSEGKIYVVVGIILVVLIGFIIYLLMLDRKVKKLEKMLEDRQRQGK